MALDISGVGPVPPVQRDSPTNRKASAAPPTRRRDEEAVQLDRRRPGRPRKTTKAPKAPASVEAALVSAPRTVTNRVSGDLWDLLGARADELGVPIRTVLTDALVRALETDVETHREKVKETRKREQLARIENS